MIEYLTGSFLLRASLFVACSVLVATALTTSIEAKSEDPRASHFSLKNGMDVVVIPDNRAPVVTHMVWYRVGAADEPIGTSGIAHFLEHLMFKGTEEVPPGEFSKIVAANGGEDNAFTSQDVTAYFQRVAKDRLGLVMKMEADRMANLRLNKKDVVTERDVVLEERRSRVENEPSSILSEQMMAALYQSHPYGIPIIGWKHEIEDLDRKDALAFYERFYAPENAILVVAGDVTVAKVQKLAAETYGKVKQAKKAQLRDRPKEPKHRAARRLRLEDPRAGQATVQRLYVCPSYATAKPGEAEALDIMMKIAGSGSTSRLYKKLVVEKKMAAGAGGWFSGSGLDSGRIGVYAVAGNGADIATVEKEIDAVIAEIIAKGVTQVELDRARNSMIAEFVYGSDSQSRLARRYGWGMATGRSLEDIEAWPERLKKVTVDDVKKVAEQYFDTKQSVTGVLLPTKKQPDKAPHANGKQKS